MTLRGKCQAKTFLKDHLKKKSRGILSPAFSVLYTGKTNGKTSAKTLCSYLFYFYFKKIKFYHQKVFVYKDYFVFIQINKIASNSQRAQTNFRPFFSADCNNRRKARSPA